MTVYRVGDAGATVFDEHGEPVYLLTRGQVIVPGVSTTPGTLAHQHAENERVRSALAGKRVHGYADKRVSAYDDKATG